MNKEQKMKKEAREQIIECLKEGYAGYYSDLHHEVFNTGYYIIGTWKAKKVLEEYGIWDAIAKVQRYEKENFGEVYIDLGDPEKVANMLFYIIGEEVLYNMLDNSKTWRDNWDNIATDEMNTKILEELGE